VRRAEPVAGLGGMLLLASLLLPWYRATGPDFWLEAERAPERSAAMPAFSALDAMTVIDVVIALIALLAVLVPVTSLASSGPSRPIAVAVLASAFGPIAIVLVAFRMLDLPGEGLELRYGAWVALAASLIAWLGSWRSMADDSTPGAVPPEVRRRPAP
jgi:hypothetical protein